MKGRTSKLCVLNKWDFNFCVCSSPLRGFMQCDGFGTQRTSQYIHCYSHCAGAKRSHILCSFTRSDEKGRMGMKHQKSINLSTISASILVLPKRKMEKKRGTRHQSFLETKVFFFFPPEQSSFSSEIGRVHQISP